MPKGCPCRPTDLCAADNLGLFPSTSEGICGVPKCAPRTLAGLHAHLTGTHGHRVYAWSAKMVVSMGIMFCLTLILLLQASALGGPPLGSCGWYE